MSAELASLEVRECKAELFKDCDLVFSGLDSDVAGDVGEFVPFPSRQKSRHPLLSIRRIMNRIVKLIRLTITKRWSF